MKTKLLTIVIAALLLVSLAGCKCEHEWVEANCYTPKTCSKCEETEGEALGHDWLDATCEEPETCDRCGETEGEALGHSWLEATCEAPETCENCGETKGEALGHTWEEATCVTAKTCTVCSATEGEALGHTEGEPVVELNITELKSTETVDCTVCGEQISSETVEVTTFLTDTGFAFTPNQLAERMQSVLGQTSPYRAQTTVVDSSMGTLLYTGETPLAVVTYQDMGSTFLTDPDSNEVGSMMVVFYASDDTTLIFSMLNIVMTCDPTLDSEAAGNVVTGMIEASGSLSPYNHNGISYLLLTYQGQIMMFIDVEGAN